jgi:transposase-like protein
VKPARRSTWYPRSVLSTAERACATAQRLRHSGLVVLTKVPKADADMVATWIRTIFTMGTPGAVRAQLDHVADTLTTSHPRVAEMPGEAKADLTAFSDFPPRALAQDLVDQPAIC